MEPALPAGDAAGPSAGRPLVDRYLAANVALWLLTYILVSVRVLIGMNTPWPRMLEMAGRRAGVAAAAVLGCILIQRVLLRTRHWPMARRIALALGLSVLGVTYWTLVNYAAFYVIVPLQTWDGNLREWLLSAVQQGSVLIWSFIAWCAIVLALSYDEEAREHALRLVQAQALAAESQNQMLRYQINPHFLFNTLNALSSLILQKDFVRAERMVLSLSNFLRASLEKAPGERITLAEELAAQRQYLAIEQERFGDRLRLTEDVPAALEGALAPGLILQPLIENAVKYGVARTRRPVTIAISAEARDGQLAITVADDAEPDLPHEPQTLGVGLANVRRRLEVMYGPAGRLAAGPRPGGGFSATVTLPLERRA